MANPRAAVGESIRYISGDTLELKIAVSEEWSQLLTEIKDLTSSKTKRAVSAEEALFIAMIEYKKKNDPLLKAQRSEQRSRSASSGELPAKSFPRRRRIPSRVAHAVTLRDGGRCTFTDRHGKRCSAKRWTELHHVKAFADGGAHTTENLQTLCWSHHCLAHRN